jgi:hypothetical protein
MKQKDIALIVVVVIISGFLSFFVSEKLFGGEKNRSVQVKTVEAISTEFNTPDKKYFNDQSINPTQTIIIGNNQPEAAQPSEQR